MAGRAKFRAVALVGTAERDQPTIRLTLDVLAGATPISGVVHGGSGADREFVGWTALASVIDAALTTNGEASGRPSVAAGEGKCTCGEPRR
ncbi:MAG: hypothetical protein ACRD12_01810 [Acidimicrobiales bacterium]